MDIISMILARNQSGEKLAYTETKTESLFPGLDMDKMPIGFEAGFGLLNTSVGLQIGETYTVKWDGVEYICIATEVNHAEFTGIGLGNLFPYGLDNTGEPFGIVEADGSIMILDIANGGIEGTSQHFIDILIETEIVHPIDPKYIPGAVLPVVELSEETMQVLFASGEASLTTVEATIFYNALQNMLPVIMKGDFNGIKFSGVSNIYIDNVYENYFEATTGIYPLRVFVATDENGIAGGIIKSIAS